MDKKREREGRKEGWEEGREGERERETHSARPREKEARREKLCLHPLQTSLQLPVARTEPTAARGP